MPPEIRMTEAQWNDLRCHVLQDSDEHAAILICGAVDADGPVLTCRTVVALHDGDVRIGESGLHLEVSPVAIARLAKQARIECLTVVICHSHPFGGPVRPSPIDLATEEELCGRVLYERLEHRPTGSLIVGPDGVSARIWMDRRCVNATLRLVGKSITLLSETPSGAEGEPKGGVSIAPRGRSAYDRQILFWGSEGQRRIADTRVAVIGAGGTGSHVITQLAHLGVGAFLLIDPDVVEWTNLSRILGADTQSVGRPKVNVLAQHILRINPDLVVEAMNLSILDLDPMVLAAADVIFCCTDGHGSRLLLTELAQQYLVPVIDMGIEIQPADSTRAGGGVRILRPGSACLHCMGVLDAGLVREEFLSDHERRVEAGRGYLRSGMVDAPSVVALNGVVASLAVVEFFDLVIGVFTNGPSRLLYRGELRSLSTAGSDSDPRCYVCGPRGLLGLGGARPLPRRQPRAG